LSDLLLAFLGPAQISQPQTGQISFANRKALALLAYLAVEAADAHSRETLLGLLWPELPTAAAQNNLRVTWSQLRQMLKQPKDEAPPFLIATRLDLQFNQHSDYELDVNRFHTLLEACRTHAHPGQSVCTICIGHLTEAVALVRGPFLAGLYLEECPAFDEWLLIQRERLHLQITTALEELADLHERAADGASVIQNVQRLLELDPLREDAYRWLMRLLAGGGQRSAAMAQYETCKHLLQEQLGVTPAPETILLAEQIRALATTQTETHAHNLPPELTRFIGRSAERAQLQVLLTQAAPNILTLVGPGGVGKTRLALQVAHHLVNRFPHGVWLVDLAVVNNALLVPDAIAGALKVLPEASRPLKTTLVDYLRDKSILLVLDNCEHLLETCAQLVKTFVTAAPGLVVLATSRTPLHLPAERVMRLDPLASPQLEQIETLTASAALQHDAIQLFASRAAQALLNFSITDANAAPIAKICLHLDGIPLAIELAAARAGFMPVQDIAQRLDQRFRWLNAHTVEKLPRQQTLRALIDWSYELLSEPERILFKRLSIFPSSWTLEAAEAICNEQDGCGDTLGHLVDQSLVVFGYDPQQERYRMHESIRQFAREQLRSSGEEMVVLEKHARYYAQMVRLAVENQAGLSLLERLRQLQADHDNLRSALAWSIEQKSSLALELVTHLGMELKFWELCGYFEEGRRWLKRVLEATSDSRSPLRVQALLAAAELSSAISDFEYGQACVAESRRIASRLGDRQGEVDARLASAELAAFQGDYTNLAASIQEAMTIAGEIHYKTGLARGERLLGKVAYNHSDHEQAIAHLVRSVSLWRELDRPYELAAALNTLGASLVDHYQYAFASDILQETVEIYRALGYQRGVALALQNLGDAATELKAYTQASELHCEGLLIRRKLGLRRGYAYSFESLAYLACLENQAARAVQLFAAASALRQLLGAPLEVSTQERYAASLAQIWNEIGPMRYEMEWSKGSTLSAERAIELALG
jgi:predicted ATPase/DNA-binding SARP family transcriptional activator